MKPANQIPYHTSDGLPLGFRTIEAAARLVAGGHVKPAYGRKGHLKSGTTMAAAQVLEPVLAATGQIFQEVAEDRGVIDEKKAA